MDIDRNPDPEILRAARAAVDEIEWLEIARTIKTQILTDLPRLPAKMKGESL